MEVKFYKKCRLGTALDISRKEVAVQRDSAKYRIWSVTDKNDIRATPYDKDYEFPVQIDGCSTWVRTGVNEWSCIEPNW